MKFLIVALAVACAHAYPDVSHVVRGDADAPILRSSYEISAEGNFQYAYETGNGINAQAEGVIKNPDSDYPALEIKGSASYTSPEGEPIELSYIADENGYQATGSHVPTSPPIPEAIARSLEYIAANSPQTAGQPFAAASSYSGASAFGAGPSSGFGNSFRQGR